MNIICFGDSNTYGFDPRSYLGGRYQSEDRWVDILREKTGWKIQNEGMNGREIPRAPIRIPASTDLLMVMLGGNDLLQGAGPAEAAERMRLFLCSLSLEKRSVILIGPPPVSLGAWVPDRAMIEASVCLHEEYRSLAHQLGILFVPTLEWNIPLCFDGVHFTEQGHHIFAENLYSFLNTAKEITTYEAN